jgi:hypothetical protein
MPEGRHLSEEDSSKIYTQDSNKEDTNLLFKNFIYYTFKNKYIICFLLVLEYLIIYLQVIACIPKIFSSFYDKNGYGNYQADQIVTKYAEVFLFISGLNPFVYFKRNLIYTKCTTISKSPLIQKCDISTFTYVLFYIFLVLFTSIYLINTKSKKFEFKKRSSSSNSNKILSKNEKNNCLEFFKFFYVNLYDMILHTFSIYIIYPSMIICIISYSIPSGATFENLILISINMLISFLFFIFFISMIIMFINEVNILSEIGKNEGARISFHYERYFSVNYDIFLLILKILICFESALFYIGVNNKNLIIFPAYINTFLNIIILVLVILFTSIIIIRVLHSKNTSKTQSIIYLINPVYSNLRIFLLIFTSLSIIFFLYSINFINNLPVSFISLCFLTLLIFSFLITKFLSYKNKVNIYAAEKFVYTFIHLYMYRHVENSNIILEMGTYHSLYCKKVEDCNVCHNGLKNFNFEEVKHIGDKYLKNLNSQEKKLYNQSELEMLIYMKLILLEELEGDKKILLIQKTKKYILNEKYRKESKKLFAKNFYYNLCMFYDYLLAEIKICNNYVNIVNGHSNKKSFLETYTWFSKLNSTCLLLEQSADKILKLYQAFTYKERKEIFTFAQEINEYKEDIMKNLYFLFQDNQNLHSSYFSFTSNYTLESLKYIYQNLFNPIIEIPMLDSTGYEDNLEYLEECYRDDKLINISFNYLEKDLKLLRLSKELNSFRGKKIEDLFPHQISKEGKQLFIDKILNTTTNRFTFEYYLTKRNSDSAEVSKDKYINIIKMDCLICFTFNLNEFLIIAKYEIINEDILMINTTHMDGIVNFSEEVGKFFYLTVELLDYMSKSGNFFSLRNMLKLSKTKSIIINSNFNDNVNDNINIFNYPLTTTTIYDFDLKEYYKYYMKKLSIILKEYEDEKLNIYLQNLTQSLIDRDALEANFRNNQENLIQNRNQMIKIDSIRNNYQNFCHDNFKRKNSLYIEFFQKHVHFQNQENFQTFYCLTLQIRDKIKNFTIFKINEDIKSINIHFNKRKETYTENNFQIKKIQVEDFITENTITNNSMNGFTSVLDFQINNRSFNQQKNLLPLISHNQQNILETEIKNNKNLKTLKRYLMVFSFIVIIFCFSTMVIGFSNNKKLYSILEIKIQFTCIEIYFYHIVTSLVNNVIIHAKTNPNNESSAYVQFADEYLKNLNNIPGVNLEINSFINKEILFKLETFDSALEIFNTAYYNSIFEIDIKNIINQYQEFYTLSRIDNQIQVLTNPKMIFSEALNVFMNKIREVLINNKDKWIFIKILSFKNYVADLSNFQFVGVETISTTQMLMYELLINYVNMSKGITTVSSRIDELYMKVINQVFFISIILTLILVVSHLVLLGIGIKLIFHFKRILKDTSRMTNQLLCRPFNYFYFYQSLIFLGIFPC